jgi:hypothetical protein
VKAGSSSDRPVGKTDSEGWDVMIRRSCHTETALDRASRRPDGAADHRPPGDPRPATLDDRRRARPQSTGHDPPAPPPARRRPDRGDAVARRSTGRPLRDHATTARTDHRLAGGDRRRTADRPRDRRRRSSPSRLAARPVPRSFRMSGTISEGAVSEESLPWPFEIGRLRWRTGRALTRGAASCVGNRPGPAPSDASHGPSQEQPGEADEDNRG